jgi:biopolymer transport protein ExbB/TolQ
LTEKLNNATSYPQAFSGFPMWITFSFALLAIVACLLSIRAAVVAQNAARMMASQPAALRSLASKLQSTEQSLEETSEALKVLANRVKMQRVRTAANHTSDPPIADETAKDALRRRAGLTAGQPARHQ